MTSSRNGPAWREPPAEAVRAEGVRAATVHANTVRAAASALLAALALITAGCARVPGVYVVVHGSSGGSAAIIDGGNFSAGGYVDGIWSSRVLPAYRARAVDAPVLISALAAGPAKACARYGNIAAQGSPCAFMIKGTGRIAGVTSALSGTQLVVDFPPYDGKDEVSIAVGPAFLGTAVRDALSFIKFAQFTNQVDYADVGIALNDKVRSDVIAGRTFTSARGHTITFLGATEGEDPKGIVVTPVQLSVGS